VLNTDPAYLMNEIRAAEEMRRRIITNTTALVRKYVGNWYPLRPAQRQAAAGKT